MQSHHKKDMPLRRRSFLGAMLVSGIAPQFVPANVFGANERPRIGIIGKGGPIIHQVAINRAFDSILECVAVCDVRRDKREEFADRKDLTLCVDYRELLERSDIDAVMIGTPEHMHAVPAVHAARAGKDIYCEKPMAFTIAECKTVVDEVRRCGVVFQTGSQQRSEFNDRFRRAVELIRNGRIGEIQEVHKCVESARRPTLFQLPEEPNRGEVDWDRWLGPAACRPYNWSLCDRWKQHGDFSGGSLTDGGAHRFDIIQWALDADDSGPVEVIPADPATQSPLTFKYANGVPVYCDGKGVPEIWALYFVGTKGTITVGRDRLLSDPEDILKSRIGPNEIQIPPNGGHVPNWIECMHTREKPICHEEIGARSATICHMGNIVTRLGRPLKWDPVRQQFQDAEANRLMDYAHREPWTLT